MVRFLPVGWFRWRKDVDRTPQHSHHVTQFYTLLIPDHLYLAQVTKIILERRVRGTNHLCCRAGSFLRRAVPAPTPMAASLLAATWRTQSVDPTARPRLQLERGPCLQQQLRTV